MSDFGLEKINEYIYRIPRGYRADMIVPGFIYADEALAQRAAQEGVLEQVVNVATLPGIIRGSFAMPDIHLGYGFAVGGVAAFDVKNGIVSPGGVGFDINCGVRLLKTNLVAAEISASMRQKLMHELSRNISYGIGGHGKVRLSQLQLEEVLYRGVPWAVSHGYGLDDDIEYCEQNGRLDTAEPNKVSERAFQRGANQLGTLGSGNHFLEVQELTQILDNNAASIFGLFEGQLLVMIHSGSRGFGHQVCTDYLKVMAGATAKYGLSPIDRQLAYAPLGTDEASDYLKAMACAMNYAWVNRHMMAHFTRESFEFIFKKSAEALGMDLLYDVAHNSAKLETHQLDGETKKAVVHRKGATRAFAPNHPEIPQAYQGTGQPVFVPGDMGRASYILSGTKEAMKQTFGSTCHGAGRVLSRSRAKKQISGNELKQDLLARGIIVITSHVPSLAEEAPEAYKDVNEVVEICDGAKISKKVAKLRPLGVLKG
ncbi:MAG: RtcB family protein [Actinobacteria bacterium]|nr:MAG: RtcB family protein [Actinomycetota bacterium]